MKCKSRILKNANRIAESYDKIMNDAENVDEFF